MRITVTLLICCIASISGRGQTKTLAECIDIGIANNLSVGNARIGMSKGRTGVSQSRSKLLPTVQGVAQFTDYLKSPVNVTTGTLLGNDFPDDPTWQTIKSTKYNTNAGIHNMYDKTLVDKFSGAVGVTLSVPIFHFGERRGKIRSAKAALRMAQLELDDNRELMALELSQAHHTLKEQAEALEIARLSVEQATENLRLSRSAYNSGVETLSDHLEAQALWQSALADEIDARAQLLVALSKWRKAAGR